MSSWSRPRIGLRSRRTRRALDRRIAGYLPERVWPAPRRGLARSWLDRWPGACPAAALGGAIGLVAGEFVIGLFRGGLLGRALSWAVLGLGIGLGQGLADRSRAAADLRADRRRARRFPGRIRVRMAGCGLPESTGLRRGRGVVQAIGIVILGAGLGLCLALVEQVLRRAWVQVLSGRQEGRTYLLAHPRCSTGAGRTRRDRDLRRCLGRASACRDRVQCGRLRPSSPGDIGRDARQRDARLGRPATQ